MLVGDRGMITQARIDEDLRPAGLDWITALRAPALKELVGGGHLQMSLFDERDMAAITSPDFPGERLIVCRNPDLARERARKHEDLLAATARDLAKIAASVAHKTRPLRGVAEIGMTVGAVLDRHKMAKHFELTIADDRFAFARKRDEIAQEAALDGLYGVRTSLPEGALADDAAVRAYKSLAQVERAFRCLKTVDLHVRPIYHWLTERVRAHVFLCMLAYYVEWHMRARLALMLYEDNDKAAAEALRESPVAKAQRSPSALAKSATGRTPDGARSTASRACSPISRRSPETRSWPPTPPTAPSQSSPARRPSNKRPSTSSDSPSPVPSSPTPKPLAAREIKALRRAERKKLRLAAR